MIKTVILAIVLSGLVAACSDNNDRIVGHYTYNMEINNTEAIAEIRKDGDIFLFNDNVLRNKGGMVLSNTKDGLFLRSTPIKLSNDGNKLYFGSISAIRVNSSNVQSRLKKKDEDKKLCASLTSEMDKNYELMKRSEWDAYINSVKAKLPQDCHPLALIR